MSKANREWVFWVLLGAAISLWVGFHFSALLACPGSCYIDLGALHGYPVGHLELDDTRLNTWILAWSQHAILTPGASLFDANALYPAPATLAGSEHLLGEALVTLPLRGFTDNAVLIYAIALMASYAILGLSTALCVRWLLGSKSTSSLVIAIASGLVAMAMPWRTAELSHLQLLWACWFPLIFGLAMRLLLREGSWRESTLLGVVLTLQLLSSYYLAYMVTFVLAITSLVVIVIHGLDRPSLLRLLAPALVPYGILGLLSMPYLSRSARGEISVTLDPDRPMAGDHLGNAIDMLLPRIDTLWQQNPDFEIAYSIPASILALALFSWLRIDNRKDRPSFLSQSFDRTRSASLALWLSCLVAFVMTLGSHIRLGESDFRLPSYWAAITLPGFSNLRAPHRWAIVIGTLMPLLAALGAAGLIQRCASWTSGRRWVAATLGLLVLVNFSWTRLPTLPAFPENTARDALYAKLGELPFGPVLEIPWPLDSLSRNSKDSGYMVASTRHWRPILNGFTAHVPPSFALLNRVAQGLPSREAVKRIGGLTDLRWVVVHWDELRPHQKAAWWGDAPGGLELIYRNQEGAILEIPEPPARGRWMRELLNEAPSSLTLTGLSREPLGPLPSDAGIVSVKTGPTFRYMGVQPLFRRLEVQIANPGPETWPGLDLQPEGLIKLRYAFSDLDEKVVETGSLSLDADMPPGLNTLFPTLSPPPRSGRYMLCLDLIQIIDGKAMRLPLDATELEVQVSGVAENRGDALERLATTYRAYRHKEPQEIRSRCAIERARAARASDPAAPGL
ncbi:MAG: hypothetical protein P8Q97_10060 [Myxococcota bacterium]|jgi:hypothetical protein|nr:hypothetical protein [Myxococcota bacterium]